MGLSGMTVSPESVAMEEAQIVVPDRTPYSPKFIEARELYRFADKNEAARAADADA